MVSAAICRPLKSSASLVWMFRRPTFQLPPTLPLSRPPPRMSIGCDVPAAPERPMRREKNRSTACGCPNWKVVAFSRKNGRFSGKNRSKRVRLTCSSSASTCAKSVFTVTSIVRLGVTPHFRSTPTSASRSSWSEVREKSLLAEPST